MRHSSAGPSSNAGKSTAGVTAASPSGFQKGADGKWGKSGSASPDDAASRSTSSPKVQHFAPTDSPKGSPKVTRPSGAEFDKAGQQVGLEIWRIEKLKPAPVAPAQFGKFYSGDSYIVLNTYHTKEGQRRYDAHFWLGTETSQDEAGVAAYKTVELDDKLGGAPVQHREVQHHETPLFLSYFKGGVQYLEGGIESGFKHVDRDAYTKRLLHLKGKRNVRVKDVPISHKSLNNGDVFVLDCGLNLYQFNGAEASKMEKAKGLEVTSNINSNERGAKAKIHIIEFPRDNDKPEAKKFWEELGGEGPIASAAEGGDDAQEEKASAAAVKLYRVSDSSGELVVTEVASVPLKKSQLDTNDCFIVDIGTQIFVWVGKGSTQQEKSSSLTYATQFLANSGRPDWTPITRVVEGGEANNFKSQFSNWSDVSNPSSRPKLTKNTASSPSQSRIDVNAMHTSTRSLETSSVKVIKHKGGGDLKVWRVENFKLSEVPKETYGLFFAGDSYVIKYSEKRPGSDDLHFIYFWQGRTSSADEKGASAYLAKELDDSLNGKATQIRVVQNKEPDHFLALFQGGIIVLQGGHPSGFHSISHQLAPTGENPVHLYHVKASSEQTIRSCEVEAKASSLNSGDAFVVVQQDETIVWLGRGSSASEQKLAATAADRLSGGKPVTQVAEGSESDSFWATLGGKAEYDTSAATQENPKEPRLFWGSNASGVFKIEEIYDFTQDDLNEDDVYILDLYNEVYVWVGSGANDVEKKMAMETAIDFVTNAPDGRSADTPIYRINAGAEPVMFTSHFVAWDSAEPDVYKRKMRQLQIAEAGVSTPTSVRAELKNMQAKDSYPYAELIASPKPKGVDTNALEKYLTEAEFQQVLGMTRDKFEALPGWKKSDLKKQKKLF